MSKKFYNKDGLEVKRTPCQKYSRVSGFITPVSNYNIGKKSEFYSRKFYSMETSMNSKFIEDYSTECTQIDAYTVIKTKSNIKIPVCCK